VPGPSSLVAVDVVLLLPPSLDRLVRRLNGELDPPPAGFRFDDTHLPHLTLAQQAIPRAELLDLVDRLAAVFRDHPPLPLGTTDVVHGRTASTLGVANTPALQALHEGVAAVAQAWPDREPDEAAFVTDAAGIRAADRAWVAAFRRESSHARFDPHVTLGIGRLERPVRAIPFVATRAALCQLGRFCTCRRVLAAWTLKRASRSAASPSPSA